MTRTASTCDVHKRDLVYKIAGGRVDAVGNARQRTP
jgi:hypothetical protein